MKNIDFQISKQNRIYLFENEEICLKGPYIYNVHTERGRRFRQNVDSNVIKIGKTLKICRHRGEGV